jgi:LmbE family N-acetylglucosaminyl deacetylase
MHSVFVFAHQDDEIAFVSRMRRCERTTCVYLTDGASRVAAGVRNAESRRVLGTLGVTDTRFTACVRDGELPDHLADALRTLEREVEHAGEVVTLAWEGGHQDHDAAHLVAAVFAKRRGIPCIEMPLYNGHGTRGPFFRVQHPIGDGWESRSITQREKLANAALARHYKTQRSTWIALAPLMLLAPARELTRVADLERTRSRPHEGALYYERRFHYPYERFATLAEEFRRGTATED